VKGAELAGAQGVLSRMARDSESWKVPSASAPLGRHASAADEATYRLASLRTRRLPPASTGTATAGANARVLRSGAASRVGLGARHGTTSGAVTGAAAARVERKRDQHDQHQKAKDRRPAHCLGPPTRDSEGGRIDGGRLGIP